MNKQIEAAKEHFGRLLEKELKRAEALKTAAPPKDFSALRAVKIGLCAGDGIGPAITEAAARALDALLAPEIEAGAVTLIPIGGLTIENRLKHGKAIPDDVLAAIKDCDVILKGPTATPSAADGGVNLPSANVAMRKALDLYANVRPVKIAAEKIDWVFFRENTEGAYALGSEGLDVSADLSVDFTVTTEGGTRRIVRAAFEYAKANGKTRVSCITKANIVKATDGKFLRIFYEIAADYPKITADDFYIDIAAAMLLENRRAALQVMVLPNLYGDILTDEAAQIQGGVGTAGSANLGNRYAMFEAVHGTAPRMFLENRAAYADPSSMLRAAELLLRHIGRAPLAQTLGRALERAQTAAPITGYPDGATTAQFTEQILRVLREK